MRLWRLSKTLREDKCKLFKNQTCQPWKQSHSRHPSFYNLPTKRLSRGFWTEIYALLVNQTMQTVMFTRKKGISIILVWLFVLCTYNILPKERLEILRERICKLSSTQTLLNSTSNMKNIAKDFHHQKSDRYTPKQNPNSTTILIKNMGRNRIKTISE